MVPPPAGVNVYDTCGGREATLRAAVSAVVEGGYLDPPHCRPAPHVGVLHTHVDHPQLPSFLQVSPRGVRCWLLSLYYVYA